MATLVQSVLEFETDSEFETIGEFEKTHYSLSALLDELVIAFFTVSPLAKHFIKVISFFDGFQFSCFDVALFVASI